MNLNKDDKKKKSAVTIEKYLRTLGIVTKPTKKIEGETRKILVFDENFFEVAKSYILRDENFENRISRLRSVMGVTVQEKK